MPIKLSRLVPNYLEHHADAKWPPRHLESRAVSVLRNPINPRVSRSSLAPLESYSNLAIKLLTSFKRTHLEYTKRTRTNIHLDPPQ